VEYAPVADAYRNPRLKFMFTGNSESTSSFFDLLRHMGASAREMLIAAAADRWSVPAVECHAAGGSVHHPTTGRSLTFGDLAEAAAQLTPPEKPPLKSEGEWKLLGRSLPRVELPAKVNGTAIFGLDFKVPGMVYAAAKQSPVFGGKLTGFDKRAVMGMPGVIDVVPIPNGAAVVAKTYWEARKALDALPLSFEEGPNAALSSDSLARQYRDALSGDRWLTVRAEGRFQDASEAELESVYPDRFTAEYESQFLAHATMEPMNCTAHVTADACRIWGPLQGPELAQIVVSQAMGLPKEKVKIERTLLGGGFGRRLLADFVLQAALVSRAVGLPVKVVWTREEDMQQDSYRPATLHRIRGWLDPDGGEQLPRLPDRADGRDPAHRSPLHQQRRAAPGRPRRGGPGDAGPGSRQRAVRGHRPPHPLPALEPARLPDGLTQTWSDPMRELGDIHEPGPGWMPYKNLGIAADVPGYIPVFEGSGQAAGVGRGCRTQRPSRHARRGGDVRRRHSARCPVGSCHRGTGGSRVDEGQTAAHMRQLPQA
jgi:Molybdopterin-binding domain of aldehyde dehydrogenase